MYKTIKNSWALFTGIGIMMIAHGLQGNLMGIRSVIEKNFPKSSYEITKLENDFGPAVIEGSVEALVVSKETSNKGILLNELRVKGNLPPVETVIVPMVLAEDGGIISTTRIKNSEIDSSGNLN